MCDTYIYSLVWGDKTKRTSHVWYKIHLNRNIKVYQYIKVLDSLKHTTVPYLVGRVIY